MNDLNKKLNTVRSRVSEACEKAGRNPSEVRILAVSKRHPTERILGLYQAGMQAFGESYVQEALTKIDALAGKGIEWHFIGPLQSNKTRDVAARFDWVHSVDREKLLRRLSAHRLAELPPLNICIQVNIDREPQKSGAAPEQVRDLLQLAAGLPNIRLRGLMAIPKAGSAEHDPSDSYRKMQQLFKQHRDSLKGQELDTLSMGMSADLEAAIACGSTLVRIGTDLFGPRNVSDKGNR